MSIFNISSSLIRLCSLLLLVSCQSDTEVWFKLLASRQILVVISVSWSWVSWNFKLSCLFKFLDIVTKYSLTKKKKNCGKVSESCWKNITSLLFNLIPEAQVFCLMVNGHNVMTILPILISHNWAIPVICLLHALSASVSNLLHFALSFLYMDVEQLISYS